MARKLLMTILLATVALAGVAIADNETDNNLFVRRNVMAPGPVPAAVTTMAKAAGDTIYLMGGPDRQDGKFEDAQGNADWQGWTSRDFSTDIVEAWHISTERVIAGTRSMVCGLDLPVASGVEFGYGNNWKNALVFTYPVDDPSADSTVRLTGSMHVDTEPEFDFVYVQIFKQGFWQDVEDGVRYDGMQDLALDVTTGIDGGDYAGSGHDEVQLRIYFESDTAFSDQDGDFDSDGPCWVDDLTVFIDGAQVDFEDFEDDDPGLWQDILIPGVGDFAALYSNLQDLDPCRSNRSVQVAFVDNGSVVPGTGGSPCITWCYGPGGYIVNNTGGLLDPSYKLQNGIVSPPMQWVDSCDAAQLVFGVYVHEPMTAVSGGVMYQWHVRSTTSDDPSMLQYENWVNDYSVWYGPPIYANQTIDMTTFLKPGRRWFQVRMWAWEAGYIWDINGADGTPHPYLDNIRVLTYPFDGPAINYDGLYVAQDNFPEQGDIDFGNLANNSVRFDMARNISPAADLVNDPGDSIYIDVVPVRAGSTLPQLPQMVVRMRANPLFDGVRTLPVGFVQNGDIITGTVVGDSTYGASGALVADRYNFDLPDTGFFYPGDVIHYCFEAWDNLGGDVGHTMLPGDTAGFSNFHHDLLYPSEFICRALPTMRSATPGDQPKILYWNDFGSRGGEDEWLFALNGAGLEESVDYDLYDTNQPDAGEGNGLGGRATSVLLAGYDILLYNSGDMLVYCLSNGDFNTDPSQDIQVISSWLDRGDKKAFLTGDNLVFDLTQNGSEGGAFINNYLGVQLVDREVRPYIGNQTAPVVKTLNHDVFALADEWIAYGGCLGINAFDAIETVGTGVNLAEFTAPGGDVGTYPYSAASYNRNSTSGSEVVLMPYGFNYIHNTPDYEPPAGLAGVSARSVMLRDLLNFFGMPLEGPVGVDDVPAVGDLEVSAYPNPFNPQTTVALNLPRAGRVSVKIYNVRGALVRTLVDGDMAAGPHKLVWDGCDESGARSASGVYFAETRSLGQTRVTRMAMIK